MTPHENSPAAGTARAVEDNPARTLDQKNTNEREVDPQELCADSIKKELIDGARLADEIATAIRSFVIMPGWCADTVTLWIFHTHLFHCSDISPRLAVISPEPECGKTTLFDVIARLALKAVQLPNITTAGFFRFVDANRPTLLLDEADKFLSDNEELVGIINAGHRRGGSILRVDQEFKPQHFKYYCAVAIACIGELKDRALRTRTISIDLKRKAPDEVTFPFRSYNTPELDVLLKELVQFANENASRLMGHEPDTSGLGNRAADNWRPLYSIADLLNDDWASRARLAAASSSRRWSESTIGSELLDDIEQVLLKHVGEKVTTKELVWGLVAMEDRPWKNIGRNGAPMDSIKLASLLRPYGIHSRNIKIGNSVPKGYHRGDFDDALKRYGSKTRYLATNVENED